MTEVLSEEEINRLIKAINDEPGPEITFAIIDRICGGGGQSFCNFAKPHKRFTKKTLN